MTVTAKEFPSIEPASKHPFYWFVLLGGIAALAFYAFAGVMIIRYGGLAKDFGWQYKATGDRWYVSEVDRAGVAVGLLEPGDQIIAINGDTQKLRIGPDLNLHLRLDVIPAESPYTVRISRDGVEREFELSARLERDYNNLWRILPLTVVGVVFYALAMMIGLLRPDERVCQIAVVLALGHAIGTLSAALFSIEHFFNGFERVVQYSMLGLDTILFALTYHFFYMFPAGGPQAKFWPSLKRIFYVAATIQFIPRVVMRGIGIAGEQASYIFTRYAILENYVRLDGTLYAAVAAFVTIASAAVIARNYRDAKEADRRRIKWVVYGTAIGVLPTIVFFLVFIVMASFGSSYVPSANNFSMLLALANISSVIIPITIGYAILKHRVLDINIIIRRGLQYLLAKNVLQILLSLPLVALAFTVVSNPDRTIGEILSRNSIYFYLIIAAAVSLRFRRQLREWIDRKFFRESYNQEKILLGLVDEIKGMRSMSEISRQVSEQLEAAIHPKHIYAFYRDEQEHDLALGYSSGGSARDLRIPGNYQLLHCMEREESALEYWAGGRNSLPENEREWLDQLEINLIVPMSRADHHLVGLLLLGEKKSEEPYTPRDRRLLEAIARQMAIVYENVWLKDRVEREQKIKRDVLARFEEQNINLVKECPACGLCFDSNQERCPGDESELTLSLPVERTVEGKYRLDRLIGKGGMGAVYEAMDLRLDRKVAVKIMLSQMFGDRSSLRRFEREARASARLNHQNIITVYDYGAIGAEGAYLVMELIKGSTLRAELQRAGRLTPAVAALWFDQIFEAMKAAHNLGIIHRDLKPENVLISKQENGATRIKILDFGLAKLLQMDLSDQKTMTARGMVLGTFGYMSPEQLTGEEVDERTDIFAIGVMIVEALTGSRPFKGRTQNELLMSVLNQPFHLAGDAPAARRLDDCLQMCLAKNPVDRFRFVGDAQIELISAIRNCPSIEATAIAAMDGEETIPRQRPR